MITEFLPLVLMAHATNITVSTSVPGMPANSASTPGAFVAGLYQFALMIAGVLAFGVIIYAGVKYMTSAGNPSGQGDAKGWIEAALIGLLLLVGAYFVLNVVNPRLVNLQLPTPTPINTTASTASSPSLGAPVGTGGGFAGACTVNSCPTGHCVPVTSGGHYCSN